MAKKKSEAEKDKERRLVKVRLKSGEGNRKEEPPKNSLQEVQKNFPNVKAQRADDVRRIGTNLLVLVQKTKSHNGRRNIRTTNGVLRTMYLKRRSFDCRENVLALGYDRKTLGLGDRRGSTPKTRRNLIKKEKQNFLPVMT